MLNSVTDTPSLMTPKKFPSAPILTSSSELTEKHPPTLPLVLVDTLKSLVEAGLGVSKGSADLAAYTASAMEVGRLRLLRLSMLAVSETGMAAVEGVGMEVSVALSTEEVGTIRTEDVVGVSKDVTLTEDSWLSDSVVELLSAVDTDAVPAATLAVVEASSDVVNVAEEASVLVDPLPMVALASAVASSSKSSVALASSSRKTLASTVPANADKPKLRRGIRCASIVPVALMAVPTESFKAK